MYQKVNDNSDIDIKSAKIQLLTILKEHNGNTKHPEVLVAIDNLTNLWRNSKDESVLEISTSPANSAAVNGDWISISAPPYPGRKIKKTQDQQQADLCYQYTLGRLSFNIFQPKELLCTINSITNAIHTVESGHEELGDVTYNIETDVILHTPDGDLPGEIVMEAFCYPDPENQRRTIVAFVGGAMYKPETVERDDTLNQIWMKCFGNAYSKADKERGYVESITRNAMKFILKLEMPTDNNQKYKIKRIMKGYLDYLYLDDNLKITKGNQGSITILEKKY